MNRKRIISTLAAGMMLLSAVGCSGAGGGDTIVIGGLGPLTGEASQYGVAAMNGAQMAFDEAGTILGKEIKFIPLDDKHSMEEATNAYNRLVSKEKVVAIVGPVTSAPATSVGTKSQKEGIPIIAPTATAITVTEAGPNVFRACFIDPFQGNVMANFSTRSLESKTAAVLYNTGIDYSQGLAESFRTTFLQNGGEILNYEGYGENDADFKAQLTKIAANKPEVLFLPDYYDKVSLIAKQVQEIGLDTVLLGADGWDGVLGTISDSALLEGAFYCNHYSSESEDPIVQDFIRNYKERYGIDSNSFAALGYDAAKVLIQAIEKAGSTDKNKIIAALNETNISTVTGTITFDENRNPIKSAAVLQITAGRDSLYEILEP